MSKSIGARLPNSLFAKLLSEDSEDVLVVTTVDDEGWPHPGLLDVKSVEPDGERTVRVTLVASSRAAANIERNGKLTLALVDPEMVYYIKAKVVRAVMTKHDGTMRFEAIVEEVLEDSPGPGEAGSVILTGITFRRGVSQKAR